MAKPEYEGMVSILLKLKVSFLKEIDAVLAKAGYSDRTQYIRDAIWEKMNRDGVILDKSIKLKPSRIGTGGKPTHKKEVHLPPDSPPSQGSNSAPAYPPGGALDADAALHGYAVSSQQLSREAGEPIAHKSERKRDIGQRLRRRSASPTRAPNEQDA